MCEWKLLAPLSGVASRGLCLPGWDEAPLLRHRGTITPWSPPPAREVQSVFFLGETQVGISPSDGTRPPWTLPTGADSSNPFIHPQCGRAPFPHADEGRKHLKANSLYICTDLHRGLSHPFPHLEERSFNLVFINKQWTYTEFQQFDKSWNQGLLIPS